MSNIARKFPGCTRGSTHKLGVLKPSSFAPVALLIRVSWENLATLFLSAKNPWVFSKVVALFNSELSNESSVAGFVGNASWVRVGGRRNLVPRLLAGAEAGQVPRACLRDLRCHERTRHNYVCTRLV